MEQQVILEPAAAKVCKESSVPPLIFQLPPQQGRKILEEAQNSPVYKYPAEIYRKIVNTGTWGVIPVYVVVPPALKHTHEGKSLIYYIHGAGWVFGSFHTHEKLVRELAFRTNSILVFPEYSRAPEARYPAALEQCYRILCQSRAMVEGMGWNLKGAQLTVAGDSVGGNMAIVMALWARERKGPEIHSQLLYYPVTNDCFDTCSYRQFAEGYYLYREGMMWFWNQYLPWMKERRSVSATPLCAELSQLCKMPATMILNGEADVLRDEGEAYANRLRQAGVEVTAIRFQGMIHDFVMLNALDATNACRSAMDASVSWIVRKNNCKRPEI